MTSLLNFLLVLQFQKISTQCTQAICHMAASECIIKFLKTLNYFFNSSRNEATHRISLARPQYLFEISKKLLIATYVDY